jgi:hypothetical protein
VALYVPPSRRRRRTVLLAGACIVAGLVVGAVLGRVTAPSVDDRVSDSQEQARQIAAGLRVLSLHVRSGAASTEADGEAGTDLVLRRTSEDLQRAFSDSPWISPTRQASVRRELDALSALTDRTSEEFADAADGLAADIEVAFGLGEAPAETSAGPTIGG